MPLRQGAELDRVGDELVNQQAQQLSRLRVQPNRRTVNDDSRAMNAMDQQLIEHQGSRSVPAQSE